ncbi:hypothetical protein [Micromonospora parathelypteridis]|uniref:Uncharacterized protein n=1 Tax=Micromonospora parathelypteridis TaxID=1839617 RepID=A0A840VYK9_9ACTN|nr:hypothetical protein [Micromonospora parathelypteridis]MBB5476081.1 hypothetical protein [Micromonospora parathelypteridis]GGO32668.1 hypothetical protein GCM10011576_63410 [Micromonospora parathelypteridis]
MEYALPPGTLAQINPVVASAGDDTEHGGNSAVRVSAINSLIEERPMSVQAFLYVVAVILIALAALPLRTRGVSLALLGAACAVLAYAWPVITG